MAKEIQIRYRKLLEVRVQHDYFLLPGGEYPHDYRVGDFLEIRPAPETQTLLRNQRMLFRATNQGFVILADAQFLSGPNAFATRINLAPGAVFRFHWRIRDPYFPNYTNLRLSEPERRIFQASNRTAIVAGATLYLNRPVPAFGTSYYGEPAYRLGDLVQESGKTYELVQKDSPLVNFGTNSARFQELASSVVHYVNPSDRIAWQGAVYLHERTNTTPGELIKFVLKNVDGVPVELGTIPGTTIPQGQYQTSAQASEGVHHSIDLHDIPEGLYSLEITEGGATTNRSFYLLDPLTQPHLFGVTEFFVTAPAGTRFTVRDVPSGRWLLDDPHKVFLVRFRNRSTKWRYLKQDESLFHEPAAYRPLTRAYSGYQVSISGTMVNMPDPSPAVLEPEMDTGLVKNLFSKIYLTK